QQLVHVDAQLLRVSGIQRVFRVHEGGSATEFLRLRHDLQRERGLAGGLRPVDLDDPAARQAADAERDVEADGAAGNGIDVPGRTAVAQAHDRALAELLFYLAECCREGLLAILIHRILHAVCWFETCPDYFTDRGARQPAARR